jgi:hypothetical protein
MILSERQQLARSLAYELGKLNGTWVINPMPLDENANLRIQVLECDRNEVFGAIQNWGFGTPRFVSMTPRITHNGMAIAAVYEIDLPRTRQAIVDDRTIRGDLATKKHDDRERIEMLKYLGIKPR